KSLKKEQEIRKKGEGHEHEARVRQDAGAVPHLGPPAGGCCDPDCCGDVTPLRLPNTPGPGILGGVELNHKSGRRGLRPSLPVLLLAALLPSAVPALLGA